MANGEFSGNSKNAGAGVLAQGANSAQASLSSSKTFLWTITCWGGLLRFVPYLSNRSLWLDESMLALNIVNRNFSQLLRPLDYDQGSPLGFLLVEKSAVQVFGNNEYALRLFPLLCGILSLLLFYRLATRCLTARAVPIGVGLFAILGPLIYYSSEVKQFSSDVAVSLLLLSAAIHYNSRELTAPRIALLGVLGALSIWFSHPSVFVLAGIGTSLTLFSLAEQRWARIGGLAIVCFAWASSFAACYLSSLRYLSHNQALLGDWRSTFVPSPLLSFATVKWFVSTFFEIFRSPVGLELTGIGAFTFLVGYFSMLSDRRQELLILTSPIFFALCAAVLRKYPFSGRMLLFAVPAVVLLIAEGVEQIVGRTRRETPIVGACLIALLFFHPLLFSTYQVIKPNTAYLPLGVDASNVPAGVGHTREEIKPVMNYVRYHKRAGDVLYVFDATKPAFLYYAPKYHIDDMNYVFGQASGWTEHWQDYEKDIDRLRGYRRVWLVFTHLRDHEKFILYLLDSRGTRLDQFTSAGAVVYLYDLGEAAFRGSTPARYPMSAAATQERRASLELPNESPLPADRGHSLGADFLSLLSGLRVQ